MGVVVDNSADSVYYEKVMSRKKYSYMLIGLGIVGLLASFFLLLDTMKLIEDSSADIPCNINPFISCTNAALSPQGRVFGFPNPILGVISFSMVISAGFALLFFKNTSDQSNELLPFRKFIALINLGLLGSMLFVLWFIYQSLYSLGSLCIYCMVVWTVTWPLFLYTTVLYIKLSEKSLKYSFLVKNHLAILLAWYLLVILLILIQFRDYFLS